MTALLKAVHRYAGLTMLTLWLVQAGTGVLMVFHWEIGDARLAGAHRPADWPAIGATVARLERERAGSRVHAIYPSGGAPDRFDLFVDDAHDATDVVRVDGAGEVLGEWPSEHDYARAPWIETAVILHQSLFAGHRGRWLLGFSGLLLVTNLALGLKLAWGARGQWFSSLARWHRLTGKARVYVAHRAAGVLLVVPALLFVSAGAMQSFDDALEELLDAAPPAPSGVRLAGAGRISPERAISVALARFHGASFAGLAMPSDGHPWYRVRVRQPGELRRVFGTTVAYVAVDDARVLAVNDARQAPLRQRLLDGSWAVHTGEAFGLAGRLLALASAVLLLTTMFLGVTLWWRNRARAWATPAT